MGEVDRGMSGPNRICGLLGCCGSYDVLLVMILERVDCLSSGVVVT